MQPGPYGAPPAAPVNLEPLKPSGWWYVFAVGVGAAGIIGAIVIAVVSFNRFIDHIDGFARVDVPGTDSVRLEEGDYTVFAEFPGANDDFADEPFVDFSITDPDGDTVDLDDYFGESTYSADSHEGLALFTFTANETGEYTISSEGDEATLAIGKGGLFGGAMGGFIGAGVLGFASVVFAIIATIVVAVKRSGARTRRQLALARASWGSGGPPGWPGPTPPPGYPSAGPPGYPPAQPGYPPGYPPAQQGYPPAGTPGYPPAQPGYPSSDSGDQPTTPQGAPPPTGDQPADRGEAPKPADPPS